jgi:hypothetical protein
MGSPVLDAAIVVDLSGARRRQDVPRHRRRRLGYRPRTRFIWTGRPILRHFEIDCVYLVV